MRFSVTQALLLGFAVVAHGVFLVCFTLGVDVGMLACEVSGGVFFLLTILWGVIYAEEQFVTGHFSEDSRHNQSRIQVDKLVEQLAERCEQLELAESRLEESSKRILSIEQENLYYKQKSESLSEELEKVKSFLEGSNKRFSARLGAGAESVHALFSGKKSMDSEDAADSGRLNAPGNVADSGSRKQFEDTVDSESWKNSEDVTDSELLNISDEIMASESLEHSERVDIAKAAESAVRKMRDAVERAGLDVRILAPDERLYAQVDRGLMDTLFTSIIDNSVKHMNRSGMLQITLSEVADDLFIVMKDNGEGISSQAASHIFEQYDPANKQRDGTGHGLAQVASIVEQYGGKVYARSERNKGFGVYIRLPKAAADEVAYAA